MSAGLPGLGLGGLFFILSALALPLFELARTARGESSAQSWLAVARQFGLAVAMIAAIDAVFRLLDARSKDTAGATSEVDGTAPEAAPQQSRGPSRDDAGGAYAEGTPRGAEGPGSPPDRGGGGGDGSGGSNDAPPGPPAMTPSGREIPGGPPSAPDGRGSGGRPESGPGSTGSAPRGGRS